MSYGKGFLYEKLHVPKVILHRLVQEKRSACERGDAGELRGARSTLFVAPADDWVEGAEYTIRVGPGSVPRRAFEDLKRPSRPRSSQKKASATAKKSK